MVDKEIKEQIIRDYIDNWLSLNEISKKYGIKSKSYISQYILGDKVRSSSEAVKQANKKHPNKFKLSEETKRNMSKQRKGENNSFYGKNHSDKTKKKLSETRREKELAKGENNPMYGLKGDKSPIKGRKHSEEELNKMCLANPLRKEVLCIELNMRFPSLTKAEKYMKKTYNIPFGRRALAKRLNGEINIDWYGEIEINGELIKLHWKYI